MLGILNSEQLLFFSRNHTVSWQIINHYILECHIVKLTTLINAFSRSPPDFAAQNAIFRSSKMHISSECCHKSQISAI